MSCGQYVSLAPTVRFTCDYVKSPITLYLGSCLPCCSDMQNLGGSIGNVRSCCVTGVGCDNQPFSYSAIDIPQRFRWRRGLSVRCRWRMMFRLRLTRFVLRRSMFVVGIVSRFVRACVRWIFPVIFIHLTRSAGSSVSGYPRCLIRNITSGILMLRAGARPGSLYDSLLRSGSNSRLTRFMYRIARCLCVLTVRLFRIERRIILRARNGSAAFNTIAKGPIRDAIWRAACGLTPRGMNSGNASPERCEVAAVAANTDRSCLFLDDWGPTRNCSSHSRMALSATAFPRSTNHGVSVVLSTQACFARSRGSL